MGWIRRSIIFLTVVLVLFALTGMYLRYSFFAPFEQEAKGKKVLFAWSRGLGEEEWIERAKAVAPDLGWDLRVVTIKPHWATRWVVGNPLNEVAKRFDPDFILSLQDWVPYQAGTPNYLVLSHGVNMYVDQDERGPVLKNKEHAKFDAVLPVFRDRHLLAEALSREGKKPQIMEWLFASPARAFQPLEYQQIFYCGNNWDQARKGENYKAFFRQLDEEGVLSVFGPKKSWGHTPNSYKGMIPIDGKSIYGEMQKSGIALVLHSESHRLGGSPTSRIFEAVSASAIVISDRNSFIEETFGDSVLYIDVEKDSDQIFGQIMDHYHWIQSHPKEAEQMARRAHAIFSEKFTIEKMLQRVSDMNDQLTNGGKTLSRG